MSENFHFLSQSNLSKQYQSKYFWPAVYGNLRKCVIANKWENPLFEFSDVALQLEGDKHAHFSIACEQLVTILNKLFRFM